MHKLLKLALSCLMISSILTSCYKEIDLSKYKSEPKLVLNASITTDTIIMASLTRTRHYTENYRNTIIKDAKVDLFIDGVFIEQMNFEENTSHGSSLENGYYTSTTIPNENETVKIIASSEMYGEIWSEDTAPEKTIINEVRTTNIKEDSHSPSILYHITFRDNPDKRNYYLISIEDPDEYSYTGMLDYSLDQIFSNQLSFLDKFFGSDGANGRNRQVFSDESINGESYTLNIKEELPYNNASSGAYKRHITLYSITESLYRYLFTLNKLVTDGIIESLSDFGLAEPYQIHSNIHGGIGILGISNKDYKEIEFIP